MPDLAAIAHGRLWHIRDIASSRVDFRFRGKSGRAADITGTTEFDPLLPLAAQELRIAT
jgi:hypothetical protein